MAKEHFAPEGRRKIREYVSAEVMALSEERSKALRVAKSAIRRKDEFVMGVI